jgi:hypothetical protein
LSYFSPEYILSDETEELLRQLIPGANNYILTALYLEQSTVVPNIARKGTGIPYNYAKQVVSGYDMLADKVIFFENQG